MTRKKLRSLIPASAEYVIEHARWRRSRGKQPSMPYLTHRNPREALASAISVSVSRRFHEDIGMLARDYGAAILDTQPDFYHMKDVDIELAVARIVGTSSDEAELRRRLKEELGYHGNPAIRIMGTNDSDSVNVEARDLIVALGGLTLKTGAPVMMMIYSPNGTGVLSF